MQMGYVCAVTLQAVSCCYSC